MFKRFAVLFSTAGMVVTLACAQSDPGITTAVKSKFAADNTVKAYQIDVDTKDRVVTLKGAVESEAAREEAVRIARQTDGVRDVVNDLTVSSHPANMVDQARSDASEATREAREETRETSANLRQKADDLGDKTHDAADEAKARTREAARDTKELGREAEHKTADAVDKAGDALGDAAITAAVKSQFLADTRVKGLKIDVDTKNGVVTLTGPVESKAEADRAVALARDTKGVKRVVSNLKVRA